MKITNELKLQMRGSTFFHWHPERKDWEARHSRVVVASVALVSFVFICAVQILSDFYGYAGHGHFKPIPMDTPPQNLAFIIVVSVGAVVLGTYYIFGVLARPNYRRVLDDCEKVATLLNTEIITILQSNEDDLRGMAEDLLFAKARVYLKREAEMQTALQMLVDCKTISKEVIATLTGAAEEYLVNALYELFSQDHKILYTCGLADEELDYYINSARQADRNEAELRSFSEAEGALDEDEVIGSLSSLPDAPEQS